MLARFASASSSVEEQPARTKPNVPHNCTDRCNYRRKRNDSEVTVSVGCCFFAQKFRTDLNEIAN